MNIIYKKVDELIPYARNNKIHSESQIKKVAASIQEFGFKQPVVIDDKNSIIVGHARCEGAKLAGLDEVPCIVADDLSKAQIKAYRIADNKLSDLAEWDNEMIGLELQELGELDFDISLTGFDIDEVEALSNVIEGSLEDEAEEEIPEDVYQEQYGVIIMCESEAEQEKVFNEMTDQEYNCRVVTT